MLDKLSNYHNLHRALQVTCDAATNTESDKSSSKAASQIGVADSFREIWLAVSDCQSKITENSHKKILRDRNQQKI